MKTVSSQLKKSFLFLFVLCSLFSSSFAQKNFAIKSNWSANPFHQSALIENKGQFDGLDGLKNSEIEYAVQNDGVEIYFTRTGFTYKHNEYIIPKEEEHESKNKSGKEEEDEKKVPSVPHYVYVQFENANAANTESVIESDRITTY